MVCQVYDTAANSNANQVHGMYIHVHVHACFLGAFQVRIHIIVILQISIPNYCSLNLTWYCTLLLITCAHTLCIL